MSQTKEKEKNKKQNSTKQCNRARNPDGTFAKYNNFSDKYQEKFADELIEFFKVPITKMEYRKKFNKDGVLVFEEPIMLTGDFPTFGMFAMKIGVSVSSLKAWAGITEGGRYKHDRFASAYARTKEWAEGMLRSGALTGKLDSNMAKFVLANDYNMSDKSQQEVKYQIVVPDEVAEESK